MPTYGIAHLWAQGDPMRRLVAALLVAMSVVSWSVIVLKAFAFARLRRHAGCCAQRHFRETGDGGDGVAALGRPGTPFFELASAGQRALAHHVASGAAHRGRVDLSEWLLRCLRASVSESSARLQRGLGLLASIGSTAPFVGLLGTVWGIYHALLALGASGDASLEHVAGPVGEALIMTALGLCVAIPAVLGYHALARVSRDIVAQLNRFAYGVHTLLLTGSVPAPCAPMKERV
ncbi:MotA/TolQ/ExbB proton channel family protein [Paraburkholderia silvatlantica]|uniref:MotA/TolQ/ExbB proton channel family protein n=1 Tax=Paraburkholderia silvatlantica TaxID=321895 RepID=UPI00105D3521|nr:MotA/TolQ/ExbB proton channel family protein [Paraburkholderia silvatlantica]TDQ97452.1 outer membrane transport energization protein ExbB [Paraburkholderia silvatlantica]